MEHRSRGLFKSSRMARRGSLERQHRQRSRSANAEDQLLSSSLERNHQRRTEPPPATAQLPSATAQRGHSSSLERLFRFRTSSSQEAPDSRGGSLEQQLQHKTDLKAATSLEKLNRFRAITSGIEALERGGGSEEGHVQPKTAAPIPSSASMEKLYRFRTISSAHEASERGGGGLGKGGSPEVHSQTKTAAPIPSSASMEKLFRFRTISSGPEAVGQGGGSLERHHRSRASGGGVEANNLLNRSLQGGSLLLHGWAGEDSKRASPKELAAQESSLSKKQKNQASGDKRVDEVRRQLEEERQTSRRTIAKLQRDLARLKSERVHNQRDGREGVVRELERERMLRVETEQRLADMRLDSHSCRARLHLLQDEFRKMEEMVRDMMQYKTKIDQLKQEKASLGLTYENNLQKCRTHISSLERENMLLLNQVKKLECQVHGKGDERDKSRLLLERLKMVETENSGLVLENEQQRQQYEKCLDQIANQVVQALLAQKTLREECTKLQARVRDLELQNRQLNVLFQQRVRFPSDPTMQHMGGASAFVLQAEGGAGEVTTAQFLQGSAVSLHSLFSETMMDDAPGHAQMCTPPPWLRERLEQALGDDVSLSSSSTGSPPSPKNSSHPPHPSNGEKNSGTPGLAASRKTKIETEFPATKNSSPKMKHVNVLNRGTRSLERVGVEGSGLAVQPGRGSTGCVRKGKVRRSSDSQPVSQLSEPVNQLSEQAWRRLEAQVKSRSKLPLKQSVSAEAVAQVSSPSSQLLRSSPGLKRISPVSSKSSSSSSSASSSSGSRLPPKSGIAVRSKSGPSSLNKNGEVRSKPKAGSETCRPASGRFGKVKMRAKSSGSSRESSQSPRRNAQRNSMPPALPLHSQYYYDYSDEDSDSRPVSRVYSCASTSTVSLNELLDTGADADFTLDDDFFSDWSSMCLSPQHRLPNPAHGPLSRPQGPSKSPPQREASPSSNNSSSSSPDNLHRKVLSRGVSPLTKAGSKTFVKAERDDSGCEVEPSQSDRSESSQAGVSLAGEPRAGSEERTGSAARVGEEGSSQVPVVMNGDSANCREESSVLCEVSRSPQSATRIQLPSPQVALLMNTLAGKSDSEQSSVSDSSRTVSPDKQPTSSQASDAKREDLSESRGLRSSASDSAFSNDLISSVISREAFGCTPKLKSQPLSAEDRVRACRPDQLILAPSDRNFSVHGFTSSSSSCEDKSPFKAVNGAQEPASIRGASAQVHTNSGIPKPKKVPPPVPSKPGKSPIGAAATANNLTSTAKIDLSNTSTAQVDLSHTSTDSGISSADTSRTNGSGTADSSNDRGKKGGGSGGSGKFPPDTNLTVGFMRVQAQQLDQLASEDTVRDFVSSIVKDMKERVARHSHWPIITTTPHPHLKSLDSSLESLRVERSGSKDDGYSTMSSDIQPIAMETYAFPDSLGGKEGVRKLSDGAAEPGGRVEALRRGERGVEASETDSAMETSAHSIETRHSSHSLSSQVSSSSSGENVLSPGTKVTQMARFFEDEVHKVVKSRPAGLPAHSCPWASTPSPLSPPGGRTSPESSLCLSPTIPSLSSVTTPESDSSCQRMCVSVVSHQSLVSQTTPTLSLSSAASMTHRSVQVTSAVTSVTSSGVTSPPTSPCVGQRIQDLVHSFQGALTDKPSSATAASFSPPHRPADLPEAICDFTKYQITDVSKRNSACSPTDLQQVSPSRRENAMSWPPRKALPPTPSPASPVSCPGSWRWEIVTSPVQMMEDKLLDDIPEESGDEGEGAVQDQLPRVSNHRVKHRVLKSGVASSLPKHRPQASHSDRKVRVGQRVSERFDRRLIKAKSESNLEEKPRVVSLYDEMMTGSWDSGKMLERSLSVSEVDFRSGSICSEERIFLHRTFHRVSLDEDEINRRVANLLGKSPPCSDSDSEAEARRQLEDLWTNLMAQKPRSIPDWKPREAAHRIKQTCTPSPISVRKLDSGLPEDWILGFSEEEIERHTSSSRHQPSVCSKNLASLDLSRAGLTQDQSAGWYKKQGARTPAKQAMTREGHGHKMQEEQGHYKEQIARTLEEQQGQCENMLKGQTARLQQDPATGLHVDCPATGESDSCQSSPRSPSEDQKLFHSEFYSLCLVESNRSLASSNLSVHEHSPEHSANPAPPQHPESIHSKEFDEISQQIASLTRTVDELNRSLNSEESAGSSSDLNPSDGEAPLQAGDAASGGAWASNKQECVEGYHWVEDEFYLTTCGGEVIIGSSALLAEEEGLDDYCDEGGGEEGGLFAARDNDDAIADDAHDDFYCIRLPPRGVKQGGSRPVSGGSESDHILNNLAEFRYNSDGQLSRQHPGSNGAPPQTLSAGVGVAWNMEASSSHSSLSHALQTSTLSGANRARAQEHALADKEHRANLLDAMLPSGESNDSLSSDIGLDHMMCQRLMGRKGKMEVVRLSGPRHRPPLDPQQFFMRCGKLEEDAVAAFDFLEEVSTSDSADNLPAVEGAAARSRSISQPLSREVVMRQAQISSQHYLHAPRPLSDSDFVKFRLGKVAAEGNRRGFEYLPPSVLPPHLQRENCIQRSGHSSLPSTPPAQRRHRLKRRRKKSDTKDRSHEAAASSPLRADSADCAGRTRAVRNAGRGAKGKKSGERLRREWHDIKVGDPVSNTLSLSDSCCDSSSSQS